jgi:hypothetical protein
MDPEQERPSFEEALAEALERCERGETVEAAAAAFPEYDLIPSLVIAERLRRLGRQQATGHVFRFVTARSQN